MSQILVATAKDGQQDYRSARRERVLAVPVHGRLCVSSFPATLAPRWMPGLFPEKSEPAAAGLTVTLPRDLAGQRRDTAGKAYNAGRQA